MIPDQALILFAVLFIIAVIVGIGTDRIYDRIHEKHCDKQDHDECGADTDCHDGYVVHELSDCCDDSPETRNTEKCFHTCHDEAHNGMSISSHKHKRHYGWKRIVMFIGLAVFIAALASGQLGHDHSAHAEHAHHEHHHATIETEHEHDGFHIDLLSEDWMNVLFAGLSVIVLFVLLLASDHFVEEHLWNHIVKKHLPTIFAWTFGVLLVLGIALQHVDIDRWISDNVALMILLATLIGIIPESGPHLIFVTLFAAGVVPFPVLLASSISQDGHASIPLLAESKKSFAWAKLINCVVAIIAGFGAMILM